MPPTRLDRRNKDEQNDENKNDDTASGSDNHRIGAG